MQQAEIERLRLKLLELIDELQRPLRHKEQIAVDNAPDTIDRVQSAAERELAIHQIESEFNRLNDVRLALQRIQEGTYGTCLRCEEEIGMKRLNAVPWAACCVRCQDMADHESKEFENEKMLQPL